MWWLGGGGWRGCGEIDGEDGSDGVGVWEELDGDDEKEGVGVWEWDDGVWFEVDGDVVKSVGEFVWKWWKGFEEWGKRGGVELCLWYGKIVLWNIIFFEIMIFLVFKLYRLYFFFLNG